jgi:hypothetical protein
VDEATKVYFLDKVTAFESYANAALALLRDHGDRLEDMMPTGSQFLQTFGMPGPKALMYDRMMVMHGKYQEFRNTVLPFMIEVRVC